jgi:hypothetical protein
MATPTGGQFVFSAADPVNLVLTPDGSNVPPATNLFDLEVFTVFNDFTAEGYDGSGFAPGGTLDANGFLIAASFQANDGDYWIRNFGGQAQIVAGSGNQTVTGGILDTISGGTGNLVVIAGVENTVFVGDAAAATVNALAGNGVVHLGANDATVFAGNAETVNAGAGKGTVLLGTTATWMTIAGPTATSTYTVGGGGTTISGGADSIVAIGSKGDSFQFGALGGATVNALKGDQGIVLGDGPATIYGGFGSSVSAGAGTGLIVFGKDNISVFGPPVSGDPATLGTPDGTISLLAGNLTAVAHSSSTISTGGVGNATINTFLNPAGQLVELGSGAAAVFAGGGDTITGGAGSGLVLFTDGTTSTNMTVSGGPLPLNPLTIDNAFGTLTLNVGGLSMVGQGGDTVSAGDVSKVTLNALAGGGLNQLGTGDATVFAGNGATVEAGAGSGLIVFATGGSATVSGEFVGTNFTVASGATGAFGGAESAHIVGKGGDDTIFVGAGNQTVNAIDGSTVQAGFGSDTVFGGDGALIGIGNSAGPDVFVDGDQLWLNSTLSGGSVGFGTFQAPIATVSAAEVTVGTVVEGTTSEGFDTTNDFLFYQGQNPATTTAIVAAQKDVDVGGVQSTQFVLPDGTTMTLVGVTSITEGMFK